jgi:hypothetical protein
VFKILFLALIFSPPQVLGDPLKRLAYAEGTDLGDHDQPPASEGRAWDGNRSGQPGAQRFQGFSLKDEVSQKKIQRRRRGRGEASRPSTPICVRFSEMRLSEDPHLSHR